LVFSLGRRQGFEILGAADFSQPAIARVVDLQPDVIILDISTPESFEVAKSLGIGLPTVKIVAIAASEIEQVVLACAEAGIAGYVAPDGSEHDLIAAVEHALRGELYCSRRIAALLLRHFAMMSTQPPKRSEHVPLTRRERQILILVAEGMSNKEIGRLLRIGEATVKNHVHHILEKLHVSKRGEAAARLRATEPISRRRMGYRGADIYARSESMVLE
jgi:DNA-binding NarL/FixJ family response regulator